MKILDLLLLVKARLRDFGQKLTSTPELQVWSTCSKNGLVSWHAYDPITGCSSSFGSEDDMRIWIEQNYQKGYGRSFCSGF
jgi:hypothetical protein